MGVQLPGTPWVRFPLGTLWVLVVCSLLCVISAHTRGGVGEKGLSVWSLHVLSVFPRTGVLKVGDGAPWGAVAAVQG